MPVVEGFEVLTGSYLGQDWDAFGATVDEAIVRYARGHSESAVDTAIHGFDELLSAGLTEDLYYERWIYQLHSGYDPRDDGMTYREFFAHARDLLRSEQAKRSD